MTHEGSPSKVRFAMALHNHQPVGNFDGVFEAAYQDSYEPFLDVIADFPEIPFSLHTSGCLMEWLVEHKPAYIDRLREMVARGQLEILGGAFYEPILSMIPPQDRQGQIRGYTEYLRELLGADVRGMWMAERVWEQELVRDIAAAGIDYTLLDDFHFRKAGLRQHELFGYFTTEDQGKLVHLFPGSEPMRYMIPFQDVQAFVDYMGWVRNEYPNTLVVFGDDGEKFGTWPDTKPHVYEHGWLRRFFEALREHQDWIEVVTLAQAHETVEPLGDIYLAACSYREMTEWALPPERLLEYQHLFHSLDHHPEGGAIKEFFKGGYWRNFKARYPETKIMYARMMEVSARLESLCREDPEALGDHRVHEARQELYRGQCNCPYWHGAFGGLYLPHLRNAIYRSLIRSELKLRDFERQTRSALGGVAEASMRDYDFDGKSEYRLSNDHLVAYVDPSMGGQIYELDVLPIETNVGATLARRFEAYHDKVRNHSDQNGEDVASIHDRVVFKQEGLDQMLFYDDYLRNSLVDHFLGGELSPEAMLARRTEELGDFVHGKYRASVSKGQPGDPVVLSMTRRGTVAGAELRLTKVVELPAEGRGLRVRYQLEDLPHHELHFGVEFNFAAMAGGADDRYFHAFGAAAHAEQGRWGVDSEHRFGRLDSILDFPESDGIGLTDEWLGLDVCLAYSRSARLWTFPIQCVSQSEGGFELVHQSACLVPVWTIPAGANSWEVELEMKLDTKMADVRKLSAAAV